MPPRCGCPLRAVVGTPILWGAVGLASPVEAVLPAGERVDLVATVVGSGVVPWADHDAVAVGPGAVDPAGGGVEVAGSGWSVAALDLAAADLDGLGDPLCFVVEAFLAAEVEDLGLAAQHGGDDPGLTGEPAGQGRGDLLAGVEPCGLQSADGGAVVQEPHAGGVEPAGVRELVGGVAVHVLGKRLPHPLRARP